MLKELAKEPESLICFDLLNWHFGTTRPKVHSLCGTGEKENAEILYRFQRFSLFGRSGGIRTRGLLDPNQARYQASPHPDSLCIIPEIPDSVKRQILVFRPGEEQ